jgi:hypothetical protein
LFLNGQLVEHRIQDSMGTCLKMKREATRNMDMDNKQLMCGEVEAHTWNYKYRWQLTALTKSSSNRNNFAEELKDRKYHQRVVSSKKDYVRKSFHKNVYRNSQRDLSDV